MARPPSLISLRLLSSLLLLPTSHSSSSLLSFAHPIAFNSSFSFLRNPFIPSELRYFGGLSPTERNKGTKWSRRAPNQAGLPLQAVDFYNDMVDRGFTPDNYSYAGLLNGLCRSGRIDDAVNVYHGETHRAIRLFRKAIAENHSLDVVSYTVAICGLFRGDRLGEACSLFSQMKEAGFFPNIFTYNIMLCGLCKLRDVGMVSKLLKDMVDAGIKLDCISFNTLVGLLYKLSRFSSAFKLFIEMFNLGLKPNKATHALLAKGLYHAGKVDEASLYLKDYLEDIIFVDNTVSDFPSMQLAEILKDTVDLVAKIEKCHGV